MVYLQALESPEDQDKFQQLYERYKNLMFYVSMQYLDNIQDVEDVVQQSFLKIIENFTKISQIDCPKTRAYIVTIVENKSIDLLRSRKRLAPDGLNEDIVGQETPLPGHSGLMDALAKLPVRQMNALILRYNNGYSVPEIAAMLGLSQDAVRKMLWRARKELEKELSKERGAEHEEEQGAGAIYR